MGDGKPISVFVSYSHESNEHDDWVAELANRLRDEGFDAVIDRFIPAPGEGWRKWMRDRVVQSEYVLLVVPRRTADAFSKRRSPERASA